MALSKRAERQLFTAVNRVTQCVADGLSPTDAVVKTAAEMQTPREQLPLLVQAYNQGQATHHRAETEDAGLLDKLASYPIARIEDVQAALYPNEIEAPNVAQQKTAISCDWSKPPKLPSDKVKKVIFDDVWQKVAAAQPKPEPLPRDQDWLCRRQHCDGLRRQKEAVEARRVACATGDKLAAALDDLEQYFRQLPQSRMSFADVERNAELMFGKAAEHLMDFAHDASGCKDARAADAPIRAIPVSVDEAPFSLIKRAIDLSQEAYERFCDAAEKRAGLGMGGVALGAGVGGGIKELVSRALAQNNTDPVDSAVAELGSPEHENELRQIEAQALLASLINNDEVISGYDPDEVVEAYNELASLTPRAATQIGLMRPLLRKRLTAGAVEPFEGQQLLDIEKNIQSLQQPSGILQNAKPAGPSSIVG